MANEEKMEQKQEGRKHNLKVFVIMIPLLIVSLLGLIVFSRENFKESVKEYFAMYDTGFFDVLMHSGIYKRVVAAKDNHYIDCKKGTPADKWVIPW